MWLLEMSARPSLKLFCPTSGLLLTVVIYSSTKFFPSHFEDGEQTRPEYEASVKTTRINPVTKKREPFLSTWNKVVRVAVSASSVIFMVRNRL